MIKKKIVKKNFNMLVFRDDSMPGFASYVVNSMKSGIPIVFLNIHSSFRCAVEEDVDAKEIIITSLMHEFGHALEEFFDMPANEDFMHRVTEAFQEHYYKRPSTEEILEKIDNPPEATPALSKLLEGLDKERKNEKNKDI